VGITFPLAPDAILLAAIVSGVELRTKRPRLANYFNSDIWNIFFYFYWLTFDVYFLQILWPLIVSSKVIYTARRTLRILGVTSFDQFRFRGLKDYIRTS
jgi:hypothetical protein